MNTSIKHFSIILLVLSNTNSFAQKNTISAGGLATGAGGTVSYSIGQIDYISATGTGGTANQGLQQPLRVNVNLKYFIEGYYQGAGLMTPVLLNEGVDFNPSSTNVDTVTIELHNTTAPYL